MPRRSGGRRTYKRLSTYTNQLVALMEQAKKGQGRVAPDSAPEEAADDAGKDR
jgi:hypothetical protein